MFYPKLHSRIINNAPKKEDGSTTYQITFKLNTMGEGVFEYTIVDEVLGQGAYLHYLDVYACFQKELQEYEHYLKTKQNDSKEKALESRLKDNEISSSVIEKIKEQLLNYKQLIEDYKNGKEKVLHSIVGKIIGDFKKQNINIDPLVLKETIIKLI